MIVENGKFVLVELLKVKSVVFYWEFMFMWVMFEMLDMIE